MADSDYFNYIELPLHKMDNKKTVMIQGVRFRFTTGAIAEWQLMQPEEDKDVLTYCKHAISGDFIQMGNVYLASYKAGAHNGHVQPIELKSAAQLWDWLDDVTLEEKQPLIEALHDSISDQLAIKEKVYQMLKNQTPEKKSLNE